MADVWDLSESEALLSSHLPPSLCQIIDPFVEVEIIGLPVDCCKGQTRVVDDNGQLPVLHSSVLDCL